MKCTTCNERHAMHTIRFSQVTLELCCWCYVARGEAPADWHQACREAAESQKP